MSHARNLATGSGTIAWRVSIDGLPYDFVTRREMEDTADSLGRARYVGLISRGFKFAERVDLPTAAWEPTGMSVKIANIADRATELFSKKPTAITHLAADWTSGGTITVTSTTDFAASGFAYIGFQTFLYTSLGGGGVTFVGSTGQQFNTPPLSHYVGEGEGLAYPEITNWPRSIEGRRVRFYAYGSGDDPQGNGTQVWVGIARSEAKFNGTEWSFRVDPLSGIWDCDMAADLEKPYSIRGIYYGFRDPLVITIMEASGTTSIGSRVALTRLMLCGHWEDQPSFLADLTTLMQDALSNTISGTFTQTTIAAVALGDSWGVSYTTSSSAKWLQVYGGASAVYGEHGDLVSASDGALSPKWFDSGGEEITTVANSTTYTMPLVGGSLRRPGTVPRVCIGNGPNMASANANSAVIPDNNRVGVSATGFPEGRVYLSDTPNSNATTAIVAWTPNGIGTVERGFTSAIEIDTTDNWLTLDAVTVGTETVPRVATADNPPELRLGNTLATGSLYDLLSALQTGSPTYCMLGSWPFIHAGSASGASADIDLATSALEIEAAAAPSALYSDRVYTFYAPHSLREIIEQECRLLGVYPCYNGSGQIVFRRLRMPSPGEASGATLDGSEIVVSENTLLTYERSPFGLFNTIELKLGYDPVADEHTAPLVRIRDVNAYSTNPTAKTLRIQPFSEDHRRRVKYETCVLVGSRVLGVFGAPYSLLTVSVPLTQFSTTLGTVVDLTWSKVPAGDGTLGVSSRLGLVVGREWNMMEGRGTLTIFLTDQRVGGYAPGGKIAAISGASGGTGPFTVTLSSDYFPTGTEADDFFEAGDEIRLFRWNSTSTTGNFTDTIDSVSGNTITFTTAGAWTHAAITWALGAAVSTAITEENQKAFVYIAASTARVEWAASDFDPAFTLA
jgi:hypothetical protein